MNRFGRSLGSAAAALALLPAGALAAAPAKPTVKQAQGTLGVSLEGVFPIASGAVTTTGRPVRVNGTVRPWVPGQKVVVHAFMGHTLIKSATVAVVRSAGGTYGHFSVRFAARPAGQVFVSVVHASTKALDRLVKDASFATLIPQASFGSSGRFVQLIQSRLAALHLYIPQTGVYDNGTGLAIDAYHRLLGWSTSEVLDSATTASLMAGVGAFSLRDPVPGRHAEGNLAKQLLALAIGNQVVEIYPISSGKPSTPTILGHFHVYMKDPGYLPDGMYFSNFFTGGYAIHGYNPAPDYPASHGCMRVPIVDAISIFNWLQVGNTVDTYY